MARVADRVPEDAAGDLFVDSSCIARDTCRRLAPGIHGGGAWDPAHVARQPGSPAEWHRALMALVSCPVAAIGTASKVPASEAARALPDPVPGADGVHQCGMIAVQDDPKCHLIPSC